MFKWRHRIYNYGTNAVSSTVNVSEVDSEVEPKLEKGTGVDHVMSVLASIVDAQVRLSHCYSFCLKNSSTSLFV